MRRTRGIRPEGQRASSTALAEVALSCYVSHHSRYRKPHHVADAADRIGEILDAIQVLAHSPLIGRKHKGGRREPVIGQGVRGYVLLYRYAVEIDCVFVLAARAQREGRYRQK